MMEKKNYRILGVYRDNGKEDGNYSLGFRVGIMEKKMETTLICWRYIGIMEKKMQTPHAARCLQDLWC